MDDLDDDFKKFLTTIEDLKNYYSEDEQHIINAWIRKLQDDLDDDNDKLIRNEYAYFLKNMMQEPEKGLEFPFNRMPSESKLRRLSDFKGKKSSRSLSWDDGGSRKSELKSDRISPQRSRTSEQKSDRISPQRSRTSEQKSGRISEQRSRTSEQTSRTSEKSPERRKRCCQFQKQLEIVEEYKTPQNIQSIDINEFENGEEMAKIIARSKGQSVIEFVAALSPHTSDKGVKLRNALKVESTSFKEYVNRIVSQRIQDLTDILAKEQKAELERIKNQIDQWQLEMVHCRNRIQEILPEFDFDLHERDKDYLRKFFILDLQKQQHRKLSARALADDDDLTEWKEEACHRLRWFHEEINKLEREEEEIMQQNKETRSKMLTLESRIAIKEQNHIENMRSLQSELDALKKENCAIESEIKKLCHSFEKPEDPQRRRSSKNY